MCHLPGLGQVGHSPKGNHWECWDPVPGLSVVGPPVLQPPTIWQTRSLTGWHVFIWLVGWPIAAGWLADCLSNKMSTDPPQAETSVCQVCYYFGQVDLWSDVPPNSDILWPSVLLLQSAWRLGKVALCLDVLPPGRAYLWPSVILHQVRLTCLLEGKLLPASMVIPVPLVYIKVVAC